MPLTGSSRPMVAVIGGTATADRFAQVFQALGALGAVIDPAPDVTLASVLTDPAITAVVVATPVAHRAARARETLLAGLPVLVDEPLALDAADAAELVRLAGQLGRVLMVGQSRHYHPAVRALIALCRSGHLGGIRHISAWDLEPWRRHPEQEQPADRTSDDTALVLSLMGEPPDRVTAIDSGDDRAAAGMATLHLTFPSRRAAQIQVGGAHPFTERRLVVTTEAGMAVFDDQRPWPEKLWLYPRGEAAGHPVPVEPAAPLEIMCRHFLECVATGARPLTDGADGLGLVRVRAAARRSLTIGATVGLLDGPAGTVVPPAAPGIHPSAVVEAPSSVGAGTRIWHFSHVLPGSRIGRNCNIGQNVVIGPDVIIGDGCKIQNNVSLYPGVTLEDEVFCGPGAVFTNVATPRAAIDRRHAFVPTLVRRGATIGANATIVCGHTIGRHAFIGAGTVVIRDVPDHGLVVGNPGRLIGFACLCGKRLDRAAPDAYRCPACERGYRLIDGDLQEATP